MNSLNNLDLFAPRRKPVFADLWPHQEKAIASVEAAFEKHRSTLLKMPCGTGKTRTFLEVAIRRKGRVLIVVDRNELLEQAAERFIDLTGAPVGIEQGDFRANGEHLVVGSVQSFYRDRRLHRYKPDDFSLVIFDECHKLASPTWKKIKDYFAGANILGVTATTDRADGRNIPIESLAYQYTIDEARHDGVIVPLRIVYRQIAGLKIKPKKGKADYTNDELERLVRDERVMHAYAEAWFDATPDLPTIFFTPGVGSAKRLAEIMNERRPGTPMAVYGDMNKDERKAVIKGHKRRDFPVLINFGICTEGYDDAALRVVGMGRQTQSRPLGEQMAGRVWRSHAASGKTEGILLELTPNSDNHDLFSGDLLIGNYTPDERARAKRIAQNTPGMNAEEALEKSRQELRKLEEAQNQLRQQARETYTVDIRFKPRADSDPFRMFRTRDKRIVEDHLRAGGKPASLFDIKWLKQKGVSIPAHLTDKQAKKLKRTVMFRERLGLAHPAQLEALQRNGYNGADIVRWSFDHAASVLRTLNKSQGIG